ncbi:MAG: hypothetical protein ACJ8HJ_26905 [Massilia sp.]
MTGEMLTAISKEQSIQLRGSLDSAIELVAMRMDQQAITYKNISGIDLRHNVVALGWIYNSSSASIAASARNQALVVSQGKTQDLDIISPMGCWMKNNQLFGFAAPTTPLTNSGVPYVWTVRP